MRFELPSRGKFGLTSIEMRSAKIDDLRKVPNLSDIDEIAKDEFLGYLIDDKEQLNQVSPFDRDYLFMLAVGSTLMNKLSFKTQCPCGEDINDALEIDKAHAVELEDDIEVTKDFYGTEYTFRLYNVGDERKIVDYALKDDDTYNDRYMDAQVCVCLKREITDENIQWVKNLDLSVYFAAVFFVQCGFHGIQPIKQITCPKCGKRLVVIVPIVKELMQFDTATIMSKYAEVAGNMDFKSFADMTMPEHDALISSLNAMGE